MGNSAEDRGGDSPAAPGHGHSASPRPRLVVVDDEADMLDFVERTFRREYQVERALSVQEALPLLQTGVVRVLITDRRMPGRSGAELLDAARTLQPAAVRILLTGFSDGSEAAPGADALLHKPIDAEALRAAVSEALVRRAVDG